VNFLSRVMGADNIKDGVGFDRIFVIDLVVFPCFTINVVYLNCVHEFAFSGCIKYFRDLINRPYGVIVV
jgi:hypothetical protein